MRGTIDTIARGKKNETTWRIVVTTTRGRSFELAWADDLPPTDDEVNAEWRYGKPVNWRPYRG